jgi:hypothetical protein
MGMWGKVRPEKEGSFCIRGWLTLRLSDLKKPLLPVSSEDIVEIEGPVSMFESLVRPKRTLLLDWPSKGLMIENEGPLVPFE